MAEVTENTTATPPAPNAASSLLRRDLQVIAEWIPPRSRVLDIGCGDGALLAWLAQEKQVLGRGIELRIEGVNQCIRRGLSVIQGDADFDLAHYPSGAFDYVVLSQTLQTLRNPKHVLQHLVRIGAHVIISVPNFGYWKNRLYLLLKGRMPVTRTLHYAWYDTPNIHFCTINDFRALCVAENIHITRHHYAGIGSNWRSEQAVFLLQKHI